MRRTLFMFLLLPASLVAAQSRPSSRPGESKDDWIRPLAIGSVAPDFDLPGVDGKQHRLADFADAKILLVIFTCNHCPTAQAYEERIQKLHADYTSKGVALVAISPNDPKALRLDELGYTDLSDSLEEMKIRAEQHAYKFPYLYDGEKQDVSTAYGVPATPTVFIFDEKRKLCYVGRIDDADREDKIRSHDARNALDALLAGREVPVTRTKSMGCSTKWSDKRGSVEAGMKKMAAEPVKLDSADLKQIEDIVKNKGDKLRLINVWATTCGPCLIEFPELVTISRMYRTRNFDFVSISGDWEDRRSRALEFLKKQEASNRNLIYSGRNKTDVIDVIDKDWTGGLPFTLLVRPGGEVAYKHQGPIDPLELKRAIVKELGNRY